MLCPITHLIKRLERQPVKSQIDTVTTAVLETGGSYVVPDAADNSTSHMIEIQIYGLSAFGNNQADAIRNWIKTAQRATANA